MCEGASKQTPDLKILPRRDRAPPVLKFLDPPLVPCHNRVWHIKEVYSSVAARVKHWSHMLQPFTGDGGVPMAIVVYSRRWCFINGDVVLSIRVNNSRSTQNKKQSREMRFGVQF